MRASVLCCAVLLAAVAVSAKDLKCFTCTDCLNTTPVEKKCASTGLGIGSMITDQLKHVCVKMVSANGKVVQKKCGRELECSAAKQTAKLAKDTGVESHVDKLYCCDGNLCNSAPGAHLGVMGLVLAPAVALIVA